MTRRHVGGAGPAARRRRSTAAVTLQDVADRAGVSLTTASRVVNEGSRQVGRRSPSGCNRAVAELGYTANLQARAVATGQSTMIGVALRDIADPYFSSIAAGLIEVADAQRLLVCMSSTAAHEEAEREYVALMRAQRARAVVLVGSRSDNTGARDALRAELDAFTGSGGRAAAARAGPARRGHGPAGERRGRRGAGPGPGRARAPPLRRAGRAARAADRAGPDRRIP